MPASHPGCDRSGSRPERGSAWPPVGPSGSSATHSRGPVTLPAAMALRRATVSSPPPRSRAEVKPCCSISRANRAPSNARSMAVWVIWSSSALVRLGSFAEMCTCMSMKPGITVARLRSITSAPEGRWKPGVTDTIRSSRTRIVTFLRTSGETPSIRAPAWTATSRAEAELAKARLAISPAKSVRMVGEAPFPSVRYRTRGLPDAAPTAQHLRDSAPGLGASWAQGGLRCPSSLTSRRQRPRPM